MKRKGLSARTLLVCQIQPYANCVYGKGSDVKCRREKKTACKMGGPANRVDK